MSLNDEAQQWGWRETIVDARRNLLYSQSRAVDRVRNLVTLFRSVTASTPTKTQTSNVLCFSVCHICRCHATLCMCAAVTGLMSFLQADLIKKTHIHCLLSLFDAVICAKDRIQAAPPWSQPSLFRLKRSKRRQNWEDMLVLEQKDHRLHTQVKIPN